MKRYNVVPHGAIGNTMESFFTDDLSEAIDMVSKMHKLGAETVQIYDIEKGEFIDS